VIPSRAEIEDRVRTIVSEALDRPAAEVREESSLIDDLGAESIDFLDIVFRLEKSFDIKISRGTRENGSAPAGAGCGPPALYASRSEIFFPDGRIRRSRRRIRSHHGRARRRSSPAAGAWKFPSS